MQEKNNLQPVEVGDIVECFIMKHGKVSGDMITFYKGLTIILKECYEVVGAKVKVRICNILDNCAFGLVIEEK